MATAACQAKLDELLHDPTAMAAQWMVHIAMLIYLYTIFGCLVFTSQFVRQVAVIFQLIKLFIILAGLLPCVLHRQAGSMFPGFSGTYHRPFIILTLLLANVLLAFFLAKYLDYRRRQQALKNCRCSAKCQPPCNDRPPKRCPRPCECRKRR